MKPLIKELNKISQQVVIKGWDKKAILLGNKEQLSQEQIEEVNQLLSQSKRLARAYEYKEDFRQIYETSKTVEEGKERFTEWLKKAANVYGQVLQTLPFPFRFNLQLFY